MNFIKLALKSTAGAAVAIALYHAVVSLLLFGTVAFTSLIVGSLILGGIFGCVFSAVHLRREPTFASSSITGLGFAGAMLLVSILAGTFAGFSALSVAALAVFALILGGGAFAGTRIFR